MKSSPIFQSVFFESPIGMVILNDDLTIRMANRAFHALVQEDPTDVSGKNFLSYIHQKHAGPVKDRFLRLTPGNKTSFTVDAISSVILPFKMTPSTWWNINFSIVHEERELDTTLYYVGFIQDVTLQKKNERYLVAEKENSQLAMKAAEKAAKMKSDFLANMSHEIRTPIHTIIGMGELLGETELDEEQSEYTGQIQFAAEVLLELINNVLDFSKIEAGKLSLECIEFNLHQTLESAVELVALEAHKKGIEVGVFLASQVPLQVKGDPVRLRQIVVNLFNNAVKFTSQGEITLECMSHRVEQDKETITIRVQDTGIGIPEEKLDLLFLEFTQVDSSTTRRFGGTGLGLSIAKSLSELMDGSIRVESREGYGSTFIVTISVTTSSTAPHLIPPDLGAKVLIVEDNPKLRSIAAAYLREWNCLVEEAPSGEQALELLRTAVEAGKPFDIALIDLTLPRMDGWQLASEINSDSTIHNTALILMSPRGTGSTEAKMKLLHWFDDYLGKPLAKQELLTALRDILEQETEVQSLESLSDNTDTDENLSPRTLSRQAKTKEESSGMKPSPESSITSWTGKKVLVAEDHEVNRKLFETILGGLGMKVTSVENGALAVQAAREATFDLVFMDIHMPELNGYEASRGIRDLGVTTPIIAATANAVKGELEKCLAVGMNDFLGKPFRRKDVEKVLTQWMGPPSAGKALEANNANKAKENPKIPPVPEAQNTDGMLSFGKKAHPPNPYADLLVFDSEELLDTFMGQKDTVRSVLIGYMERSKSQIIEIRRLVTTGDMEGLRSEAHGLKGASLSVSALMLGTLAKDIEHAASEQDGDVIAKLVPLLPSVFKTLVKEIKTYLQG